MYQLTGDESLIELNEAEIPLASAGAPLPFALASDGDTLLAYRTADGDPPSASEIAVLRFPRTWATLLGSPDDETIHGHPLTTAGLGPYDQVEVVNSPWIGSLAAINSVHKRALPDAFSGLHHYLFAFHDSTFECVAASVELIRRGRGKSPLDALIDLSR